MKPMNDSIRKAIRERMAEASISQVELAKRLNIERTTVTRMLSGHTGRVPENWQNLLDELGLELTAVEKDASLET